MEAIGKRPLLGYGYGTFWLPDGTGSAYLSTLLDWTPYHAHNGVLELLLDVGFVGTGLFLFVLAFGLWRAWKFAWGQHDITRLWPLVAMIYFIAGNITEANIAKYNEMNWVIFLVAFLFVSQPLTAKAPSIRVNERLDTRPQRREAVLR
jgi:O-antigen ligase